MRVVVVGAGLAGLTCARILRDAGAHVDLVEAGSRVGGRARTVREPFAVGQHVESGAEWVDTHHHRMLSLLGRYGMRLEGEGQEWTAIRRMLFVGGRLLQGDEIRELDPDIDVQLERYDELFEDIAAGIDDPARPHLHPQAAHHDARSMLDVAADAALGPFATLLAQRNSQGEFAEEQDGVSSLFVAQQRAQAAAQGVEGTVRAHRVEGGLGTLVGHLAAEVVDVLTTAEAVLAIDWSADGVEVRTDRRVIAADRVVLTCSLVAMRSIAFEPALPEPLAAAVRDLAYGTITKTAVQFASRTWSSGYATTESVAQRIYEPTIDQAVGGGPSVLMAYAGGDGGRHLAERDEAARIALITDDMRSVHGLDAEVLGAFSRAWSAQPRYGGSYAVYGPGQVTAHWAVLREPCGPISLAGEHVAAWTGYLEGAVESGETAAARLLA